jgi:hypothetical protein
MCGFILKAGPKDLLFKKYYLMSGLFPTRLTPAKIAALILTLRRQKIAKWVFELPSPYKDPRELRLVHFSPLQFSATIDFVFLEWIYNEVIPLFFTSSDG